MVDRPGQGRGADGLSEDDLIACLFRPLAASLPGAFELRDDAAAITLPEGADLVVTTDALIADVHFFADDTPADIAFKALAVNLSDLAAKAALPLAYSLALALPRGTSVAWLRSFTEGLAEAQACFGIVLSGGDTAVSRSGPLTVAITALGSVPRGQMARRGGARAGDSLYVSGTIGDAALGLALRRGDADALAWPLGEAERAALTARYLRPSPRLALRDALRAHASAAMDISDGLVIDGARLCAASSADGVIEAARVPFSSPARKVRAGRFETLITGGDDYEILAAIRQGEEAAFEQAASAAGIAATRVGALKEGRGELTVLGGDGAALRLSHTGYDHFLV